jgi:hypothetical protein
MATMSPLRPAHDRGRDGPRSVVGDLPILHLRRDGVAPPFGSSPDRLGMAEYAKFNSGSSRAR